ncbi:MAG: murein L,D-transpeptidase, partial [Rhodanobacter sp.]
MLGLLLGTAVHAQQPAAEQPLGPVAEQIRERVEQWRAAHADADAARTPGEAVAMFYEQNRFAPAWTPDTFDQLLAALRGVADDGLDPQDYGLAELQRRRAVLADAQAAPAQRAQSDLLATDACLAALLHLYRGKVDPATLDTHWNFDPRQLDQTQGLKAVREALAQGSLDALFARARPQHPYYGQLRTALAKLREVAAQGGWPAIA